MRRRFALYGLVVMATVGLTAGVFGGGAASGDDDTGAALAVSKVGLPLAWPGQAHVWAIIVRNNSDVLLSGVTVEDRLPAPFVLDSAGGPGWNCVTTSDALTCSRSSGDGILVGRQSWSAIIVTAHATRCTSAVHRDGISAQDNNDDHDDDDRGGTGDGVTVRNTATARALTPASVMASGSSSVTVRCGGPGGTPFPTAPATGTATPVPTATPVGGGPPNGTPTVSPPRPPSTTPPAGAPIHGTATPAPPFRQPTVAPVLPPVIPTAGQPGGVRVPSRGGSTGGGGGGQENPPPVIPDVDAIDRIQRDPPPAPPAPPPAPPAATEVPPARSPVVPTAAATSAATAPATAAVTPGTNATASPSATAAATATPAATAAATGTPGATATATATVPAAGTAPPAASATTTAPGGDPPPGGAGTPPVAGPPSDTPAGDTPGGGGPATSPSGGSAAGSSGPATSAGAAGTAGPAAGGGAGGAAGAPSGGSAAAGLNPPVTQPSAQFRDAQIVPGGTAANPAAPATRVEVEYTVTNTTNEPIDYSHTVVFDLAEGVTAVAAVADVGSTDVTPRRVSWGGFVLDPGQSATVRLTLDVTATPASDNRPVVLIVSTSTTGRTASGGFIDVRGGALTSERVPGMFSGGFAVAAAPAANPQAVAPAAGGRAPGLPNAGSQPARNGAAHLVVALSVVAGLLGPLVVRRGRSARR